MGMNESLSRTGSNIMKLSEVCVCVCNLSRSGPVCVLVLSGNELLTDESLSTHAIATALWHLMRRFGAVIRHWAVFWIKSHM